MDPLSPRSPLTQTKLSRPELPACEVGEGRAGVPGGNSWGSQKGRLHGCTLHRGGQAALQTLGLRWEASPATGPAEELRDKRHPACLPFTLWPPMGTSHWQDHPNPEGRGLGGSGLCREGQRGRPTRRSGAHPPCGGARGSPLSLTAEVSASPRLQTSEVKPQGLSPRKEPPPAACGGGAQI